MSKRKMSNRDKMMLYILGAFAILALVYFFVFAKLNEKKATLVAENATLQTEVSELETMDAQKDAVLEDTKEHQQMIADVLSKFPSDVRVQNVIYDLNEMYESIPDVNISSEGYNMNELFYTAAGSVEEGAVSADAADGTTIQKTQEASIAAVTADTPASEVVSAAANYTGYKSTITVAFTAPYASLKKVVDYINNSEDRMTITDISMTKSDDTVDLTCSMTICMYSITGTGELYEQPEIKNDNAGVNNIFRN